MAQFNPKQFVYHYRNGKPAYYSYDGELYCGTFPENWVEDCLEGTGPRDCGNCSCYGSWNGVFLGYCANCAQYVYNGERGRGFIDIGKELRGEDAAADAEFVLDGPSVFDTYLKEILPDDVGDKDFMNSAQLVYNLNNPDTFERVSVMLNEAENNNNDNTNNNNNNNNLSFEERYPDIDLDEVNSYYDECQRNQPDEEVTYTLDYIGGGYDGGYDSY